MDLDKKSDSPEWRAVFWITWLFGIVTLTIYTFHSWPLHYSSAHPDEYYAQFLIYGIFYLGMAGARWRYYQYNTLRMYLITLSASLFILDMTLRELKIVTPAFLSIGLGVYFIWTAIVVFAPRKHE